MQNNVAQTRFRQKAIILKNILKHSYTRQTLYVASLQDIHLQLQVSSGVVTAVFTNICQTEQMVNTKAGY